MNKMYKPVSPKSPKSKKRYFTREAFARTAQNVGNFANFGAAAATGIGLVAAAPVAIPVAATLGVTAAVAYLAAAVRDSKRRDEKSLELIKTVIKTLSVLQKFTGTLNENMSLNVKEILMLLNDTKMRNDDFSKKLLTVCEIVTLEIEDFILEHIFTKYNGR